MTDSLSPTSPLATQLARVLFQFDRISPSLGNQNGLRKSEFVFLAALTRYAEPGSAGIKASDLSNLLEVTPGAVSHMINVLEKNGYVERVSDPRDRRIVLIHPTDSGLAILEEAYQQLLVGLTGLVDYLGESDSREFIRLFTQTLVYFKHEVSLRVPPEARSVPGEIRFTPQSSD
jgi:DNA-binding MarR family transcriptional regulator